MIEESPNIIVSQKQSNKKVIAIAIVVVVAVGVIAFVAGYGKGLEDGQFEFYYVKPTQKYEVDSLVK